MGRAQYLITASVITLGCTVFTTSCLQEPAAAEADSGSMQRSGGTEPIGEVQQETGRPYQSSDFPFVVFVPDDGRDEAGGWQKADKTFHFVDRLAGVPVYFWKCRIRIEMPIRNAAEGRIPPNRAAEYSAEVANAVVDPLLASRRSWIGQGTAFCAQLKEQMDATFRSLHTMLGARVLLNP